MNIFYLHPDPVRAAQYHVDRHVVKMILETAQLLSTAHRLLDGRFLEDNDYGQLLLPAEEFGFVKQLCYRPTHINHPCSIWTRGSSENYKWLYRLMIALNDEFVYRYPGAAGKVHRAVALYGDFLETLPAKIHIGPMTEPAQAMPDKYKHQDPVTAYRRYYVGEKYRFASWKRREVPDWYYDLIPEVWTEKQQLVDFVKTSSNTSLDASKIEHLLFT